MKYGKTLPLKIMNNFKLHLIEYIINSIEVYYIVLDAEHGKLDEGDFELKVLRG